MKTTGREEGCRKGGYAENVGGTEQKSRVEETSAKTEKAWSVKRR